MRLFKQETYWLWNDLSINLDNSKIKKIQKMNIPNYYYYYIIYFYITKHQHPHFWTEAKPVVTETNHCELAEGAELKDAALSLIQSFADLSLLVFPTLAASSSYSRQSGQDHHSHCHQYWSFPCWNYGNIANILALFFILPLTPFSAFHLLCTEVFRPLCPCQISHDK